MSRGKISSLPRSMSKESTSLLNQEKWEKLLMGPTASRPGPTLLRQVSTAVMLVSRDYSSKAMTSMEPRAIMQ